MKNKVLGLAKSRIAVIVAIGFAVLFAFSTTACFGQSGGGGKSLNSATELKEYLDKQPANSPDKPIKVAMKANDAMLKGIAEVLRNAGKYVSLDLSGSPLTKIPEIAFFDTTTETGCKTLTSIIIPNSVTSIGVAAFYKCISLTSVIIPISVTSIGDSAFNSCTSLTSITIPASVTEIGNSTFYKCTSLTGITIPAGVTSIGSGAFADCTSLTGITIPTGVTSIGSSAFAGCTSLTSITIPASVEYIGTQAFTGWTASQTINIQGKANREATARWGENGLLGNWDALCKAQINYGK